MKRILALFIAFVQLMAVAISPANAEMSLWTERHVMTTAPAATTLMPPLLSQRVSHLTDIPLKNGVVHETYQSKVVNRKSKIEKVILIQDIHMNNEAQRNIAVILQNLLNRKAVDLVAVEAAFQKLNFKPYRSFPDKTINQEVADKFLDANLIGAPSYVGVTSPLAPPPFIGVDDADAYEANVDAYLDSLDVKKETARQLNLIAAALSQTKPNIFSHRLLELDQLIDDYDSGRIGAAEFIQAGFKYGWRSRQIDLFMQACRLEKTMDMKQVERERTRILDQLSEHLKPSDRDALLSRGQAYQDGALRYAELYAFLKTLLQRYGISLKAAPAFENYLSYVSLNDQIDAEQLLADIDHWKGTTFNQLASSPLQKQLLQELTWLRLTRKLSKFTLTPAEWAAYKKLRKPQWAELLDPFEQFYVNAEIRSQKMVTNLLAQNGKTAALVVGGFHAPQIKELLKQRGVSYVLVSPKVATVSEENGTPAYLSVFEQEKAPLENVFKGEKLFLGVKKIMVGAPDGNGPLYLDVAFAARRSPQPAQLIRKAIKNINQPNRPRNVIENPIKRWWRKRTSLGAGNRRPRPHHSRFSRLLGLEWLEPRATPSVSPVPVAQAPHLSTRGSELQSEFAVFSKQADTLRNEISLIDPTIVGNEVSAKVFHSDNGDQKILKIDALPAQFLNTVLPADNGYTVTYVDLGAPFGFIATETMGSNDGVEVKLYSFPSGTVDSGNAVPLIPSLKPTADSPPAQLLWKTSFIAAAGFEMKADGTKELRLKLPAGLDKLQGTIIVSVETFELEADGKTLVRKALPGSAVAGDQPAQASVETATQDNQPNGPAFESASNGGGNGNGGSNGNGNGGGNFSPAPTVPTGNASFATAAPFAYTRIPDSILWLWWKYGRFDWKYYLELGGQPPGPGGINTNFGGLPLLNPQYIAPAGGVKNLNEPPTDDLAIPAGLDPDLMELFSLDATDRVVKEHVIGIGGEGNVLQLRLKNVSEGNVTVVFMKDNEMVPEAPVDYTGGKATVSMPIPAGYEKGDVVAIIRDQENPEDMHVIFEKMKSAKQQEPQDTTHTTKNETAAPTKASAPFFVAIAAASKLFSRKPKTENKPSSVAQAVPDPKLYDDLTFGEAIEEGRISGEASHQVFRLAAADEKMLKTKIRSLLRTLHGYGTAATFLLPTDDEKILNDLIDEYKSMGDRVKFYLPSQYNSYEGLKNIVSMRKLQGQVVKGQVQFFIQKNAKVDENFLQLILALSKDPDIGQDRISVYILFGLLLNNQVWRIKSLQDLSNENSPKILELVGSQA